MPATLTPPQTVDPVVVEALLADTPAGAALVLLHTNANIPFNHAQQRQAARMIQDACREIKGMVPREKLNRMLESARERDAIEGAEIDSMIAELQDRRAGLGAEVARLAAEAERHAARRTFIETVLVQCGGMMPDVVKATAAMRGEVGC